MSLKFFYKNIKNERKKGTRRSLGNQGKIKILRSSKNQEDRKTKINIIKK